MTTETINPASDNNNGLSPEDNILTPAELSLRQNNPMTSKFAAEQAAAAEGVPPAIPTGAGPQVTLPGEATPKAEESATPSPEDKYVEQASSIDVVGMFSDDPQYKPIALYLDSQLKGLDVDRAFGKAIEYGNMDLVDKAYLNEKLGDKASQIVELSTSLFQAASAKAQAEVESVYQQFGGKDVVAQSVKFFNAKGNPQAKQALGALLNSGVKENIAYAMEQIVNFSKSAGGVVQRGQSIPLGQPSSQRGLSADEYRAAIRELGPRGRSEDYDKLAAARKLGVQQGL